METKEGWVTRGKHFERKFTCDIKFNKFISNSLLYITIPTLYQNSHFVTKPLIPCGSGRVEQWTWSSSPAVLHYTPPISPPWASARPIVVPLQGSELLRTFICRLIFEAMFAPFSNRFGSHVGSIVASVLIIFALFPRWLFRTVFGLFLWIVTPLDTQIVRLPKEKQGFLV